MSKNRETLIISIDDDNYPSDPVSSERDLLKAVLFSAISDLEKEGYVAKDALRFFLNPDSEYIFSFRSICEYLKIPPEHILESTGLVDNPEFMNSYRRVRTQMD